MSILRDIEKAERDLRFIMQCFREVLDEVGEGELARTLPWQPQGDSSDVPREKLLQAYTIAFQLLTMVEQNTAVQLRRLREADDGLSAEDGLWGQILKQAATRGIAAETIVERLPTLHVEPVLTAHPTEAKRATVLVHHRDLYLLLVKRENPVWTPSEQDAIRAEIKVVLERLWRTGEVFLDKPRVIDEVMNAVHYLAHVFPDVLPLLDSRLRHAWTDAGFQPELIAQPHALPRLTFGLWVGGDRDGHPLVTTEVTRETLQVLRHSALALHDRSLSELAAKLSLSAKIQPPPEILAAKLAEYSTLLGEDGDKALARNPHEPWRQLVNLMRSRLPLGRTERICGEH
jgi:phosphoenolpyruvate carboxylase